jgi:hypothetical protein
VPYGWLSAVAGAIVTGKEHLGALGGDLDILRAVSWFEPGTLFTDKLDRAGPGYLGAKTRSRPAPGNVHPPASKASTEI